MVCEIETDKVKLKLKSYKFPKCSFAGNCTKVKAFRVKHEGKNLGHDVFVVVVFPKIDLTLKISFIYLFFGPKRPNRY